MRGVRPFPQHTLVLLGLSCEDNQAGSDILFIRRNTWMLGVVPPPTHTHFILTEMSKLPAKVKDNIIMLSTLKIWCDVAKHTPQVRHL